MERERGGGRGEEGRGGREVKRLTGCTLAATVPTQAEQLRRESRGNPYLKCKLPWSSKFLWCKIFVTFTKTISYC